MVDRRGPTPALQSLLDQRTVPAPDLQQVVLRSQVEPGENHAEVGIVEERVSIRRSCLSAGWAAGSPVRDPVSNRLRRRDPKDVSANLRGEPAGNLLSAPPRARPISGVTG